MTLTWDRGGSVKKALIAAMTVPVLELIVSSVVAGVGPASAAPCANWVLKDPATIKHSSGFTIPINAVDTGSPVLPSGPQGSNAALLMPDGTTAWIDGRGYPSKNPQADVDTNNPATYPHAQTGRLTGGPQGNNINFSIFWFYLNPKVAMTSTYTGTIDANGKASGSDTNTQNHVQGETWNIDEPFTCSS
jgi:hypothetical protein